MRPNTILELRGSEPRAHRESNQIDDFLRINVEQPRAQDLVGGGIHHKLDQTTWIIHGLGARHGLDLGHFLDRHLDIAAFLARLGFRDAHGGQRRSDEDGGWHGHSMGCLARAFGLGLSYELILNRTEIIQGKVGLLMSAGYIAIGESVFAALAPTDQATSTLSVSELVCAGSLIHLFLAILLNQLFC